MSVLIAATATETAEGQQMGAVGLTDAFQTPMVEKLDNATKYPEKSQFGIPLGHQYAFCFVPYPSYVPGEGTNSHWTRCIPQIGSGGDNSTAMQFNSSLSKIGASLNRTNSVNSSVIYAPLFLEYVYVYMYIYVYIYVYVCMYI